MRYVVSWAHPRDGHMVSEVVEADDAQQAMSRCEARFGVLGARPERSAMTWTPYTEEER